MLVDYDELVTLSSDDYDCDPEKSLDPQSPEEHAILDMVRVYGELVRLRYKNFTPRCYPNLRCATYYPGLYAAAQEILAVGKSPTLYISFHFDNWGAYNKTHHLKAMPWKDRVVSGENTAGITYPSLTSIVKNKAKILPQFLEADHYQPNHYFVADVEDAFWERKFQENVISYCGAYDMTVEEYWSDGDILVDLDPFVYTYAYKELKKREKVFVAQWGFSVDKFFEMKKEVDALPKKTFGELRDNSSIILDLPDEDEQIRINFLLDAQKRECNGL